MPGKVVHGGSVDAEGALKFLAQMFRSGYAQGLAVSQRGAGANMSVDVSAGGGMAVETAGTARYGWISSTENVTVNTADPTNPRRDIVVAYVDLALISTAATNNNGAFKFKAVAGTPASSPADPTDSAIQASVGAGNPYVKLARLLVGTGASSVVNANITDMRTPMSPLVAYLYGGASNNLGHLVPNVSDDTVALLAAAQTFSNKALSAIGNTFSNVGAEASLFGYELLTHKTLSSAADIIATDTFTARKNLRVIVLASATGGTVNAAVFFNGDTGSNYAGRASTNGGADATAVNSAGMNWSINTAQVTRFSIVDVINLASREKLVFGNIIENAGAGASAVPERKEIAWKWANTAAQITSVTVSNTSGTGDFAPGSEVIVLGKD
jgi:hypothetical protein